LVTQFSAFLNALLVQLSCSYVFAFDVEGNYYLTDLPSFQIANYELRV
jgi:hypothetical protein